jgi:hypothetical protein
MWTVEAVLLLLMLLLMSMSDSLVHSFAVIPLRPDSLVSKSPMHLYRFFQQLAASSETNDSGIVDAEIVQESSSAVVPTSAMEQKEVIGNLVADDEWAGVTMELGELVKKAVIEDIKLKGRDFLGKDEYKIGDLSKEIDARVKQGVANIRGKSEYEVGDLVITLDEMSKNMTEKLTGKPYVVGDLSKELDKRVKNAVAKYVGKDQYEAGDLTKAVAEKVTTRVDELFANYEFGDITREVNQRRKEWVKNFLGDEAAANYKFGDISKKIATGITGKDEYQFGDVSKKLFGDLFGKKSNIEDDKK